MYCCYYKVAIVAPMALANTHEPRRTAVPITDHTSAFLAVFNFSSFPCAVTNKNPE